jgi:hypothetical protein
LSLASSSIELDLNLHQIEPFRLQGKKLGESFDRIAQGDEFIGFDFFIGEHVDGLTKVLSNGKGADDLPVVEKNLIGIDRDLGIFGTDAEDKIGPGFFKKLEGFLDNLGNSGRIDDVIKASRHDLCVVKWIWTNPLVA